ncbi:sensor histidine kinase [Flavobacterium terrigena]|uniref:sensor histidine kinase n=1 Tax=Flavobacterium terrigena TaxID=402734 RepID=UPI0015A5470C|nr:HAMP domain-containing sensor histidine kinase [Flavobacterium terrigena]
MSANRAYVTGESQYSKAQKDAVYYLTTYVHTKNAKYWDSYLREIEINKGDKLALNTLHSNPDDEKVKVGLRAGRNKDEDLDDIIWLYKKFGNISMFSIIFKIWGEANILTDELTLLGNEVHKKMVSNTLAEVEKNSLLQKIEIIGEKFTILERNFTDAIVHASWKMKSYLIFANIFFILIIISCVGIYFSMMMKKLLESTKVIELKNENLILANKELDRFVYSTSHDLRSPLTSLKGLVQIAKEEEDLEQIKYYFELMDQTISKQDQFIMDIIDYSRNKRVGKTLEPVNLHQLIDDIVQQYNHNDKIKTIKIEKNLEIDEIHSDPLRLKIIFSNLISNAIKYGDPEKSVKKIEIKIYKENDVFKIEIKDNGLGINEEILPRIFEMFFGTNHNIGSGLGLYITMEAVQVLGGTISASSRIKEGTIFTITLPNYHGN